MRFFGANLFRFPMKHIIVSLSLFLSGCIPTDDSWVTHVLENNTPRVFKDPHVLSTGLDLESRPAIPVGEVWKVTVSTSGAGLQTHWLVLYPDGRLVTSLDADPERTKVNFMTSEAKRRELAGQRARLNDERIALLSTRNPDALLAAMKAWHPERAFRVIKTIGRWSRRDEVIRLNLIEGDQIAGELPGPWWYERTGVSQLVFRKNGADCEMSQQESRAVWYPSSDWTSRLTRCDHLCLLSLREGEVRAVKIDDFIPRPLPVNWKW